MQIPLMIFLELQQVLKNWVIYQKKFVLMNYIIYLKFKKNFQKLSQVLKLLILSQRNFFELYQKEFIESGFLLPFIHPIWQTLASIDYRKFFEIASKFGSKKQSRALVSIICTTTIPLMNDQEFVEFLSNEELLFTSVSVKRNEPFTKAINDKILSLINSDTIIDIISTLLSLTSQNHSFFTSLIHQFCSKISDEQTLQLLKKLSTFSSLIGLLWAQKHRNNIQDYSTVKQIFIKASDLSNNSNETIELSKFVAVTMYRFTHEGKTWFSIFSDLEISLSDSPSSQQELIDFTNQFLNGLNNLNTILHIETINPCTLR